ncbi:sensor histidine kinase [Pedobacter deserti]|uniref:sensor histidine kinase n=1 Tax=Pedobacter deserti TaxID=2817382 RepID=UPI0021093D00|nr:HAMP domain-containing sensor histidine kinase [Pedobacter sp. SYSU D00382]
MWNSAINRLRRLHDRLIGSPDQTILQARIFHEVSIIALLLIPAAIFFNLFIGVPYAGYVLSAAFILVALLFVNSRYFGNLKASVAIFTFSMASVLAMNYYINSGAQGPTLLLFVVLMVFTISLMPSGQYKFWVVFNAAVVSALVISEYSNPQLISESYEGRASYFIDILTTYIAVIVCIGVVMAYLIRSHETEKAKVLKASKALKQANDAKTRLLSILSHDLRSPLNSIQSFLEILIDYNLSEQEEKAIKKSLLRETKNTQVMLFNLLNWTKSQMEGGVTVNLQELNLNESVEGCLKVQRAAALEKMITIRNLTAPDASIVADPDMFSLIIRNLVNNAIKFTHTGGDISIFSEVGEGFTKLMVRDNGIGISEDKQEKLFSLETQSAYGTNKEKGVGLGLLLCWEFTEMQGGKISFSSRPGEGTCFTLKFPSGQSSVISAAYASGEGKTVY